MDIGIVPGEIGILPEYREVTGTPPGGYWAYMGLVGEEGRIQEGAARPLPLSPNRTRKGGGAPLAFPLSHSFLPPPSGTRKGESYSH